jgi:DNA modification methylase
MSVHILVGDCRARLRELPEQSVQTCVTSPPYFGLRDYGMADQIGLEQTPDAFVAELVSVFREVKRVLRDDGTVWLNLGDSYGTTSGNMYTISNTPELASGGINFARPSGDQRPKNLLGIPWRVAFALQADGWYLRQDIIWHKPNPMPESVRDRCTKAHEYIFLLSKSERYYYDADAIAEDLQGPPHAPGNKASADAGHLRNDVGTDRMQKVWGESGRRNKRSVWTITTKPYSGAHFATFPPDLIEPCIKAGSKAGDTVLDPFGGAGTTGLVSDRLGRDAVLCELNPAYAKMASERIAGENPMFTDVVVA